MSLCTVIDKGTLSNLISALLLILGLLLGESPFQAMILSAGLFALSGGITNSLAIKMLFDRIPGLVGSGVIPARFRDIRREVKRLILENFFSEEYLQTFLADNAGEIDWSAYLKASKKTEGRFTAFVEAQWDRLSAPEAIRPVVRIQIDRLRDSTLGTLMMLVGSDTIEEVVTKFISSFLAAMKSRVLDAAAELRPGLDLLALELDEDRVASDLRVLLCRLVDRKLEELDADKVKRMMQDVMRRHLGWLVVWGNVFGGLLGLVAYFLASAT